MKPRCHDGNDRVSGWKPTNIIDLLKSVNVQISHMLSKLQGLFHPKPQGLYACVWVNLRTKRTWLSHGFTLPCQGS